ncbi:MAG: LamB/YcsF family protein [Fimbriimonadaceae bacterium]
MRKIDLNVDVAEGFPFDEKLAWWATSANVACGGHAGSWEIAKSAIAVFRERGARIGVHPGYPDRDTMGRVSPTPDRAADWLADVAAQVQAFVARFPRVAAYIKPHGAFYHDSTRASTPAFETLAAIVVRHRLPLMGLSGTAHEQAARYGFIREGFADRGYTPDGRLIPRGQPGAMLDDPRAIRSQVLCLARTVDSICVHGDKPNSVEHASLVYETLLYAGYDVGWR